MTRVPLPASTWPDAAVNLLSRSRIRNLNWPARVPRSISRLRACWVVHGPVRCAVTPRMCTRRVWVSITWNTCKRLRNGVDGEVGLGRGSGLIDQPVSPGASRTRRACFQAPGAPQVALGRVFLILDRPGRSCRCWPGSACGVLRPAGCGSATSTGGPARSRSPARAAGPGGSRCRPRPGRHSPPGWSTGGRSASRGRCS